VLEKIGLDYLMRYGYTGFLLAALMLQIFPEESKAFLSNAGSAVGPLCIFALGGFVYTFFRYVLGDLFLFNITHFFHFLIDKFFNNGVPSSPTAYLRKEMGVAFGQRRQAYTEITRELFDEKTAQRLKIDHGEINMLYLTSVVACISSALLFFRKANATHILFWSEIAAFVFWLFAMFMDIKQHKKEHRMVISRGRKDVEVFLKNRGYI